MKILYWLGEAFLWMFPLNFLIVTTMKIIYDVPLGEQEVVSLIFAALGVYASITLRRRRAAIRGQSK